MAMQQYKIEYLLLADAASVDSFGKLNVLGIFQNIFLSKVPGAILKFVFICSVSTTNLSNPFKISIKIKDKDNRPVDTKSPLNFDFKPQEGNKDNRVNLIIELINLQFNSFGKYEIEVFIDDKKLGSSFLEVLEKKQ